MASKHTRHVPVFYGWIILAVSFITVLAVFGVRYSFSVFYVEILNTFHWREADTAGIFSMNMVVYAIGAPAAGALVDRFGAKKVLMSGAVILAVGTALLGTAGAIWQFYVLFGVVVAAGGCLVGFVPHSAILLQWFIARRGAVFGILSAGFGLSFLSASVTDQLISAFGWRMAYVVLAGIVAAIIMPLILIFQRGKPEDLGLLPDGKTGIDREKLPPEEPANTGEDWTIRRALNTRQFWWVFLASFAFGGGLNMLAVHQVNLAENIGYSRTFGALIFSLYGIAYAIGNLSAFISDRIGREWASVIGGAAGAAGIMTLLSVADTSATWMLYLYAILAGLGMGLTDPTISATIADLFRGKNFGAIFGLTTAGAAAGAAVGPWIAGYSLESTGSYSVSLVIVAVVLAAACLFIWLAGPRRVRVPAGKGYFRG